jgi:hypothetical protein
MFHLEWVGGLRKWSEVDGKVRGAQMLTGQNVWEAKRLTSSSKGHFPLEAKRLSYLLEVISRSRLNG